MSGLELRLRWPSPHISDPAQVSTRRLTALCTGEERPLRCRSSLRKALLLALGRGAGRSAPALSHGPWPGVCAEALREPESGPGPFPAANGRGPEEGECQALLPGRGLKNFSCRCSRSIIMLCPTKGYLEEIDREGNGALKITTDTIG